MLAEVVAQADRLAGVVDELRVQRKLLVQVLLNCRPSAAPSGSWSPEFSPACLSP